MKTSFTTIALTLICAVVFAQGPQSQPPPQPLYPKGAPDSNGLKQEDVKINDHAKNGAVDADYFVYLPEKSRATRQAVIVTPGGGYGGVAHNHEGFQVAKWLNEQGIAAIVLRYRMPNGHDEIPLNDIHETFLLVRKNAAKWNIDPEKIGIMGFSAGGHLSATASVYFDKETRPAFAILIYPVITFDEQYTHSGSCNNLIGKEHNPALVKKYSAELQIKDNTPSTFIAFSDDDKVVLPKNATLYYDALKVKNIPAELHIYPTGGHGWGWNEDFAYKDEFRTSLSRWLRMQNK